MDAVGGLMDPGWNQGPRRYLLGDCSVMTLFSVDDAPFSQVCTLLEQLESISRGTSTVPKRRLHMRTLSKWFDKFTGGNVYLAFRLLLPDIDLKRVYYLKEAKLATAIGEALGLTATSRGHRLLNWRVDEKLGRSQGDLGAIVCDIVKRAEHCAVSTLTISDIDRFLDELVSCKWINGGFTKFDFTKGRPVLEDLYRSLTSRECKWITRIILKELHLRIEPRTIFDAFHGWMWKIYSTKNDMELACSKVCQLIQQGYNSASKLTDDEYRNVCAEFFAPQVGTNIAIMACGRAQGLQHVVERMNGSVCLVEQKYDGERMQVHICKTWPEMIRIFSKSGRNSTKDRFRCHEQLLKALKFRDPQNSIESIIVEGELLVYDEIKKKIEIFGTVQDLQPWKSVYRGNIHTGSRHYLVVLFDLLHLNGQDLTGKQLEFRRRLLETLVIVEPNWVELSHTSTLDFSSKVGIEDFKSLYAETLRQRMEGLIIKKIRAPYIPGNRSEWLKLKKDYIDGFGDTAEFAVIGISYGKKSSGLLDTLIVGCLANKSECEEDETVTPSFVLLFPVENGFNEEEIRLFDARLKESGLRKASDTIDAYLYSFASGFRHDIDYFVEIPFLVELLGSGFVKERGQPHYTLRFPRIRRVHFGRPVSESLSFQELQEMAEASFEIGTIDEKQHLETNLEEHANQQIFDKRRAPVVSRPNRLVFDDDTDSMDTPSKMMKKMVIEKRSLEKFKTEYFFHLPNCLPDFNQLAANLEAMGIETLYHMVAVAECSNRKCICVLSDEMTIQDFRLQFSDLIFVHNVYVIRTSDLKVFFDDNNAIDLNKLDKL